MNKVKISELPMATTLRGLVTIGVDENNNSCKVSLEFVEDAADLAEEKAGLAETATENAITATENAVTATQNSEAVTEACETATQDAIDAKNACEEATQGVTEAIEACEEATEAAQEVVEEAQRYGYLMMPESMDVYCVEEVAMGRGIEGGVRSQLYPASVKQNVLYLGDNQYIKVNQSGDITPLQVGMGEITIIPTMNTDLSVVKQVEVVSEVNTNIRMDSVNCFRLLGDGAFRKN